MSGSILVVDDDLKVLEILEQSLRKHGHDVLLARNGEEALTLFRESEPDMLLLDVMLPDMDGRDVLRILRSVPGVKFVPTLFLSSSGDPDVMDSSFETGAEDFIVKPFSLREINAKVNKALGAHRNRVALERSKLALESEVTEGRENYAQINKELQRQLLSMKTLFAVNQDLNRRLDLDEMINGFALTLVGELRISSMAFFAREQGHDERFSLQKLKGLDRKRIAQMTIDADADFAKWIGGRPGPQKLVRSGDEEWVRKLPDVRLAIFEYVTPIVVKQQLQGIVFTGPKLNGKEYNHYDLDMLKAVCNSAGIGIDNARLFSELQSTYLSTVKALVSIIEAKDAYTRGHTERVADYSMALAKKLKLTKDEMRDIAFGAVLHDIGKLLVYENILNKPGDLSKEEWDILKRHPEVGAEIIENMAFLSGTVPLVRHHHERYDGKGYPSGLVGEDIPIGARIIAVADSFDAMTTDRSYRKARGWKPALKALQSRVGSQFDPGVVAAFIELVGQDGFRPGRRGRRVPAKRKPRAQTAHRRK